MLLMEETHEVNRWDDFKWLDVHVKRHDCWFRHCSNVKGITSTIREAVVMLLLMRRICDILVHRLDWFVWYRIYTKFLEDYRRSSNIKILSQKFEGLWCSYYRREINEYAVDMGSGALICIPSFVKIVAANTEGYRKHSQHGDPISLILFFFKIRAVQKTDNTAP
jgi:hypothetical protein